MSRRILTLLRARLGAGPRGGLPVAALLSQAMIAAFLCGLVRDALPPFAYALFALTLTGALVAIPLLGELGWLLRRDEVAEWVEALPVRPVEVRLARTLHLLLLLGGLALGSLVPAAVLAPSEAGLVGRALLTLSGLGLVSLLAALLLLAQALLGERAESLLVLLQTVLVISIVVGLTLSMRAVPALAEVTRADELRPAAWLAPSTWFALPLAAPGGAAWLPWLPAGLTGVAVGLLLGTPAPSAPRGRRRGSLLVLLLSPLRLLARRFWVRRDERGPFDLVFDALPLEREVILRTVPMLGIPLAFLFVAATGEPADASGEGGARADVLALLLFTAGVVLPILLTHVPATASPDAVWIQRCAPIPESAIVGGTIKALALRFLVPLYVLLAGVAASQGGGELALRLALPGFLTSLLVLRQLYAVCVDGLPLSTAPDRIRFDLDWLGVLGGLALGLTLLAILAQRFLDTLGLAAVLGAVLLGLELVAERRLRGRPVKNS